ncbi:ATP-binding protein [Candidatus Lucifugimonas marina]|uniref:histidine kinase n=1 Tax=Candidatus Lucifugimonas marina TaxID=3038979 RepID=A0AAJ5ZD52_9CHLR|nr:GAF domain-containing protein [SAR202 cluster bacterium JH702]MDG0870760.1 GAF domain-containing protein [SAR202 cluster bacterium JH639]WFG34845.1 GAF domain-containing protein [SAR202 cluster bacterium JH545]WFG38785.1 GAF domain-containing protein [SAR202 cluster bacterium JH1073]
MATQFNNIEEPNITDEVVFSPRELGVLNEIATVVSSATDIADVYSSFAALVADVIDWDGIIVNTPCDDGRNFLIRVREGSAVEGRPAGESFEIEGSFFAEVQKSRETKMISVQEGQTAEWALNIPGIRGPLLAGVRSWIATPLTSQGNLVGVMYVQSYSSDAFSDHDRLIFERIATFVGPTIERFNSYERLLQDENQARSLLRIGRMLLGARTLDDVFDQFVQELRSVIDVDRLAIAVAQPDGQSVIDRYMYGIEVEGRPVNAVISMDALDLGGLDLSSHGYIIPPELLSEADPVGSPGMYANYKAGLRSAIFAGLRTEGRIVGTMNVKSVNEGAYAPSDLEYFEQVADHLAASIDRTLSHESEIEMNRAERERIQTQQEALRVVDVIQAKERLLTSASHELRTPLTGILAFVDLLARNRSGNLAEKELRYLSIVRRNAEDLSGKVNSLIAHAARDAGELIIRLESFDLATMLREVATDASPKLAEYGQSAALKVPENLDVIGDRRQLLVAISHLIDNALRYAPKDSTIQITGEQLGSNIEISVIDQGTGVSDDHASDIFDPFERGELTGMANSPGAGLGLTFVRAVAVGHGGDARYSKSTDGGASFTVSIPVRADTNL